MLVAMVTANNADSGGMSRQRAVMYMCCLVACGNAKASTSLFTEALVLVWCKQINTATFS